MRTVRLIKSQPDTAATRSVKKTTRQPKSGVTQAREAAATWVKEYQQTKAVTPYEQFARLFDLSA